MSRSELAIRPSALAVAALTMALAACATTQEQAPARPFRPYQLAPQSIDSDLPRQQGNEVRAAETIELGEAPPLRLNDALIQFSVDQRAARARAIKGTEMPEEARARWSAFLGQIDAFLKQSARRSVPLDVVRARVTLDAELDLDREQYGSLPDSLVAAARARALGLDLRLSQVRQLTQAAARPKPSRLQWPIEPVVVTSLFGMRNDPFEGNERFHRGVDLKATSGQLIQAAADGVVLSAGRAGGHGLRVELLHDDGTITSYSHLSVVLVQVGVRVPVHGPVGLAGSTGRSTGPHLHFEIHRGGEAVDPLGALPDPAFHDFGDNAIGAGD